MEKGKFYMVQSETLPLIIFGIAVIFGLAFPLLRSGINSRSAPSNPSVNEENGGISGGQASQKRQTPDESKYENGNKSFWIDLGIFFALSSAICLLFLLFDINIWLGLTALLALLSICSFLMGRFKNPNSR